MTGPLKPISLKRLEVVKITKSLQYFGNRKRPGFHVNISYPTDPLSEKDPKKFFFSRKL